MVVRESVACIQMPHAIASAQFARPKVAHVFLEILVLRHGFHRFGRRVWARPIVETSIELADSFGTRHSLEASDTRRKSCIHLCTGGEPVL